MINNVVLLARYGSAIVTENYGSNQIISDLPDSHSKRERDIPDTAWVTKKPENRKLIKLGWNQNTILKKIYAVMK